MRTVECRWQFGLDLTAADQSLQLGAGFVVGDHLRCELFLRRVALVLCEFVRFDFEHVGNRDFLDEIGRGRADA